MKLNTAETLLVNNPVRALIQRLYEGRLLLELGGRLDGARVGAGRRCSLERSARKTSFEAPREFREVEKLPRNAIGKVVKGCWDRGERGRDTLTENDEKAKQAHSAGFRFRSGRSRVVV